MKKIISIVGARPQFIKAAVVSKAIGESSKLKEDILHTGQHYDEKMSDIFFNEMGIPKPRWNLGVGSGRHGEQTAQMLSKIEDVLISERPDWLVVYGDTNSTLAGALAASKLHIPIAHVEAGLRSYNRKMPEEVNRILTDHMADLLFAPSESSFQILRGEGISAKKIETPGDVMYDATQLFAPIARTQSDILSTIPFAPKEFALMTIHRAESTDSADRLKTIWDSLKQTAKNCPIVVPLHPRTKAALESASIPATAPGLHLLPPVGYLDMLVLIQNARAIATDSGGLQKEAFYCRIPCATLRNETEWTELIDWGWNRLIPNPTPRSLSEFFMSDPRGTTPPEGAYGGGQASRRIAKALEQR